jgi:hypothetical protein
MVLRLLPRTLIAVLAVSVSAHLLAPPPSASASPVAPRKNAKKKRPALPLPERLPSGGRLRIQTSYSGASWDWNHDGHKIPEILIRSIQRGLYRIGADGTLGRDLVESEIASTDARLWTFRLRADAKWSDGTPLRAEHAASGLLRAAEALSHAPPEAVKRIEGYAALRSLSTSILAGATAESELTLKVQLAEPDPEFPLKLIDPRTFPARPDLAEKHRDYGFNVAHMAFLGPWMVTESNPTLRMKLRRNPEFSDARTPEFRELELWVVPGGIAAANLYSRNHLDVLLGPILDPSADGVFTESRPSLVWLQRAPGFATKCPSECMKTLSRAIDRNQLRRLRPANSWVPPELWRLQQLGPYPLEATVPAAPPSSKLHYEGPRTLRIGIASENLTLADVELLKESAESVSKSLRKTLGINSSVRILRGRDLGDSELILHLADAHDGALDSFLIHVDERKSAPPWKSWSHQAPRSRERLEEFTRISRRELVESPQLIPLGWGLQFRRMKPYVRQLPLNQKPEPDALFGKSP